MRGFAVALPWETLEEDRMRKIMNNINYEQDSDSGNSIKWTFWICCFLYIPANCFAFFAGILYRIWGMIWLIRGFFGTLFFR